MKLGVPRIGDMYTVPLNKEYWTINRLDDEYQVATVIPTGGTSVKQVLETSGVTPVINLKSSVTILGGNGTPTNPYTIQ